MSVTAKFGRIPWSFLGVGSSMKTMVISGNCDWDSLRIVDSSVHKFKIDTGHQSPVLKRRHLLV